MTHRHFKYIFIAAIIVAVPCLFIFISAIRKRPSQPFTTTVSVESGTLDVQREGGEKVRLEAGQQVVVGKMAKSDDRLKKLLEDNQRLKQTNDALRAEIEELMHRLEEMEQAKEKTDAQPEEVAVKTGIHGHVFGPDGQPAQAVSVVIKGFIKEEKLLTDADGYYKSGPLPEGGYTIICEIYPEEKPRIRLYTGEIATVDFKTSEKARLFGYIHDENGEPFSADISITDTMRRTYRTRSDEDGYYEFINVPRDNYSVQVNLGLRFEDEVADPIQIPADEIEHQHDISLNSAIISGRIVYKDTGEPVIGAYIRVWSGHGIISTHSDEKGFYYFGNSAGGSYSIAYRKAGCIYKTVRVTVPEGENFTVDDVELVALPMTWFILRDQYGQPATKKIFFLYEDATGSAGMHIQPYQNGLFQREGMQPGEYKIKITAPGYEDFEKQITVPQEGFPRNNPYEIEMEKS